jgi:hypothetical protein
MNKLQLVCRTRRKRGGRSRADFTPVGLTEQETFSPGADICDGVTLPAGVPQI